MEDLSVGPLPARRRVKPVVELVQGAAVKVKGHESGSAVMVKAVAKHLPQSKGSRES